jgi:histidine triad (HIT) family protein
MKHKKEDCIFCQFIEGRKHHRNGLPMEVLNETKHSLSFLAIDLPKKTKMNILVIPKKHFEFLEEVPDKIITDVMRNVKFMIKTIKKKYPSMNLLLNNGKDAEQYVPHVHFHIYPRERGDGLMNGMKKKLKTDRNKKEFKKIQDEIISLIKEK